MAKKSSFWTSNTSKYGTYEGERGNANQWKQTFNFTFENSDSVKTILGTEVYSILGILPTASEAEIKKAFRLLVRKHHPDKGGDRNEFERVVQAYKIITDNNQDLKSFTPRQPKPTQSSTQDEPDDQPDDEEIITPQLLTEIDDNELEALFTNDNFGAQEKKDGRHITLEIKKGIFKVRNKKGIATNCCPDFENSLRALHCDLLIDGEHIGNKFHVWDILELNGQNLRNRSYLERYQILQQIHFDPTIKILKLAIGTSAKRALFNHIKKAEKEGIVFKNLNAQFTTGKGTDQFKYKLWAECSVIVVQGRIGKHSIGMELIDTNGNREFVGYCSCSTNPPINSITEIKYLYAYRGGCLIQPSYKGPRDDVDMNECTTAQLKYKSQNNNDE